MMGKILLNKIIRKYEESSKDWRGEATGSRSFPIQQADYNLHGKSNLIEEAGVWEEKGLIHVDWFNSKSDMSRISYSLDRIPEMYDILGLVSKQERLWIAGDYVRKQLEKTKRAWIQNYYKALDEKLAAGKWPEDLDKFSEGCLWEEQGHNYKNLLHQCLEGLDALEEPLYKRIFSKSCLGDSKAFEKLLQARVIRLAKTYHNQVEPTMTHTQVLSQLYIEEYSQELSVKGDLVVCLDGNDMDLSVFRYGVSLNSEMLKHICIPSGQRIKKVITVENKANYMSMPFEPETLIVFSHGYFSPKEREILCELERQLRGNDVHYLHTGDLDYGGIQIFRYIRKQIFPELEPYRMDAEQYDNYLEWGQAIEDQTLEKLQLVKEPLLQPLIDRILEVGVGIEQECFLI